MTRDGAAWTKHKTRNILGADKEKPLTTETKH